MELVVTGGPARLEGGWQSTACTANCSLTSSLIICKRLGREVSPSDGGFVAGEPKRGATDESETEVSTRRSTSPCVTDERMERRLEQLRPLPRERTEPLLGRVLGILLQKQVLTKRKQNTKRQQNKPHTLWQDNERRMIRSRACPSTGNAGRSVRMLIN